MLPKSIHTIVDSYSIVKTVTGGTTTAAPTAFPFGVTSGDIDLLSANYGGAGQESRGYNLEILMTGTPAGTGTVVITGVASSGCEEPICSLAITVGSVVETGTWYFVDTITATDWHLGDFKKADSGNSHPCKIGFDAIGYQFIKFYVTTLTSITDLRIYARIL